MKGNHNRLGLLVQKFQRQAEQDDIGQQFLRISPSVLLLLLLFNVFSNVATTSNKIWIVGDRSMRGGEIQMKTIIETSSHATVTELTLARTHNSNFNRGQHQLVGRSPDRLPLYP